MRMKMGTLLGALLLLTVFFAFQLSKPERVKKPEESMQPEKTESRGEETK